MKTTIKYESEKHIKGTKLRDIILGSQDGIVNVLGVVLGIASATSNAILVIVAALAATFAETISMAAVAYTSTKAEKDLYLSEHKREEDEVRDVPETERDEIRQIYYKRGFRGRLLEQVVSKITSNKKVWIDTMMVEELHLPLKPELNPKFSFLVVFLFTLIGSLIPIVPFLLMPVVSAIIMTTIVSSAFLFTLGAMEAKVTRGNVIRNGLESVVIGMTAAAVGYLIGFYIGKFFKVAA